jgi:membrane protein DedA with SNARE-associated domain
LDHLIELVRPYFAQWGYLIVFGTTLLENSAFLALLVPGDAVLLLAGFYAQRAALSLPAVMGLAFAGAVTGDTIAYAIGRFGGRRIVDRWGDTLRLTTGRVERFERFFAEYGMLAVALGRVTPVVRAFNTFAAGMSRMRFGRFFVAVVLVVAVWSTVVPTVGFLFSGSLNLVRSYLGWAGAIVFIVVAGGLVYFDRRMVQRLEASLESRAESTDA